MTCGPACGGDEKVFVYAGKTFDVEGRWLRLLGLGRPFFLGWPQGHKKPPPEAPCQKANWNKKNTNEHK